MKTFLVFNFILYGCFLLYCGAEHEAGGTVDPRLAFTPLRLDLVNRGSFNVSGCMVDMLRCFEIARPDLICFWSGNWRLYSHTVCPHMREFCHDFYGPFDSYTFKFTLFERSCVYDNMYT